MEKSQAITRQLGMTKDMKGKVSNTSLGVLWLTIVIVGNLTGVLIEVWSGVEPKKIIKDMNIRDFTGPTWYMHNIWAFAWLYKSVSITYSVLKYSNWTTELKWLFRDLSLTISFFIEYYITSIIYSFSRDTFKISGHALILSMVSSMILFDGKRVLKNTGHKEIYYISNFIFIFNSYILFWTSLGFHTLIEMLIGLFVGVLTSHLVYYKRYI